MKNFANQRVLFMLDKTRETTLPGNKFFLTQQVFFFRKMSHSAEKPRSPLCLQNQLFQVKIEGGLIQAN